MTSLTVASICQFQNWTDVPLSDSDVIIVPSFASGSSYSALIFPEFFCRGVLKEALDMFVSMCWLPYSWCFLLTQSLIEYLAAFFWGAVGWFRPCKWVCRSFLCHFSHIMAPISVVPFCVQPFRLKIDGSPGIDLVFVKSFDCSLTDWYVDIPVLKATYILEISLPFLSGWNPLSHLLMSGNLTMNILLSTCPGII